MGVCVPRVHRADTDCGLAHECVRLTAPGDRRGLPEDAEVTMFGRLHAATGKITFYLTAAAPAGGVKIAWIVLG
jgi:hypothetical protein